MFSHVSQWILVSKIDINLKVKVYILSDESFKVKGVFWSLVWAPWNIFLPKWTAPSLLALKTTILGQPSPLWGFGNIIFKIWPQNSHFGRIYGHFRGLYGQKAKNGPHHRCWHWKLLYWVNLALTEVLGISLFRLGPKIAILASFMAILWVRSAPNKPKNTKMDPTIVVGIEN